MSQNAAPTASGRISPRTLLGSADAEPQIVLSRLAVATVVAAVLSAVVNSLVRVVGVALFDIPDAFEPLEPVSPAMSSIVVAVGAAVVLALMVRFTRRPVRWFYRVSGAVFVLSFLPLFMMGLEDPPQYPGTDAASLGILGFMHVVALVCTVPVLVRLSGRTSR